MSQGGVDVFYAYLKFICNIKIISKENIGIENKMDFFKSDCKSGEIMALTALSIE